MASTVARANNSIKGEDRGCKDLDEIEDVGRQRQEGLAVSMQQIRSPRMIRKPDGAQGRDVSTGEGLVVRLRSAARRDAASSEGSRGAAPRAVVPTRVRPGRLGTAGKCA